MKTQPISMFRVNLLNYEEPVQVTVQGRIIGTWTPASVRGDVVPGYLGVLEETHFPQFGQQLVSKGGPDNPLEKTPWDVIGESHPAPKPGKKK